MLIHPPQCIETNVGGTDGTCGCGQSSSRVGKKQGLLPARELKCTDVCWCGDLLKIKAWVYMRDRLRIACHTDILSSVFVGPHDDYLKSAIGSQKFSKQNNC